MRPPCLARRRHTVPLGVALIVCGCAALLFSSAARAQGATAGAPPPLDLSALKAAWEASLPAGPSCAPYNAVRGADVVGDVAGDAQRVHDGEVAVEGSLPVDGNAPSLRADGELVVDLRAPHRLRYFVLQADGDGRYVVEGSSDRVRYQPLWRVGPSSQGGAGLHTRFTVLSAEMEARYLRVRVSGGQGEHRIAELAAYCRQPQPWPPRLLTPPRVLSWAWIDQGIMVRIKACAAAFATLVLLACVATQRRRSRPIRFTCDVLLALCGLFAFASWWNLGHFHFEQRLHVWELYHHAIGAKYAPELRYTRLYECTAAADLADGLRSEVVARPMRDLGGNNELISTAAIVADPTRCTRHFSPDRWREFRDDIRSLRALFAPGLWARTQSDHGYNASPVWAILGRAIASSGPLNSATLGRIAWIDSGLLVVMWCVCAWAFGWRSTCVALLWWGYNFPAGFAWTGGALLRFDWLCALVVGLALLKKQHPFGAGIALTYATLLRVFPGLIVAALVLKVMAEAASRRRLFLARDHARFAAGCVATAAVLVPISGWATSGLDAWPEFVANSAKHLNTPLMNHMGLKTVVAYDPSTTVRKLQRPSEREPLGPWKRARLDAQQRRRPLLLVLLALFVAILTRAVRREPDWSAACLGAGLIAVAAELTCYYYGFLLAYGLLWHRAKLPGILITALASLSCALSFVTPWHDEQYTAISLATTITVALVTAWFAFRRPSAVTGEPA